MIGSLRGFVVAAAVAVALVVALAVDLARTPAAVDRAMIPGFDPARVTELVWTRGAETIDVASQLEHGDTKPRWVFRSPPAGPADPDAVEAVLAALRGARWHRVGEPTPVHATLTIVTGGERHTLGIGEPLAGTEQVWLVDGERGLLVDSWVARALDRDRLGLAITMPFADAPRASAITVQGRDPAFELRVGDSPRRLLAPASVQLAPEVATDLEHALAGITLVRAVRTEAHGLVVGIDVAGRTIRAEIGGACPGAPELVAIASAVGDGCIERPTALEQAIARLREPPAQIIERRAFAGDAKRITLADTRVLELSPPRLAGAPADPARVAELLAALAAPCEPVALPAAKPNATIHVEDRAGRTMVIELFPSRVLARRGDALALRPAPGTWDLLVRPSRELRELTPWVEEPSTISAIAIDGVTYRAGSVLGEWTREPAGAVDPKAVQALAEALAAPHAIGFAEGRPTTHRVTLTIAAPGKTVTHALELGAATPAGCPAVIDTDAVLLPAAICTRVAALAR